MHTAIQQTQVVDASLGRIGIARVGRHRPYAIQDYEPGLTRNFWWHPYDESLGRAMHAAAQILYGRDSGKLAALRDGARPLARVLGRSLRR